MPPPPPGTFSLNFVQVEELLAASQKLGFTTQINAILDTIKKEKQAKPAVDRRATLVKMALESPSTGTSSLSYTSTFVPKGSSAVTSADPMAKKRRERLIAMTEEAFPPGKPLPDPYTYIWMTARSDDTAVNKLPFITATCTVTPLNDNSESPPKNVFDSVLCLWDTGAQISFVLASQLSGEVKEGKTEGTAMMDVQIQGINTTIRSIVAFRSTLPNSSSFIILGQHAFINHLQYQIQPVAVNPDLSGTYPQAYGQAELGFWRDPGTDKNVAL